MEEGVGERLLALEKSIGPLELEVGDRRRSSLSAEIERGNNTEVLSSTAQSPEQLLVLGCRSMLKLSVGSHHVQANNVVEGNTPVTGCMTVASVGEMTTNSNARASTMRDGTFTLVPYTLGQITKTDTATYFGDIVTAQFDVLQVLKIDYYLLLRWSSHVRGNSIPIEPFLPPLLNEAYE